MKDELFALELLSGLDDDMVAEAALPSEGMGTAPLRRARGFLSAFLSSGRVAAVLSVVVSLSVLAAIILAGGGIKSEDCDPSEDMMGSVGDKEDGSTVTDLSPETEPQPWPEASEDFSYFQNGYVYYADIWGGDGWLSASGVGARRQMQALLPTLTAVTHTVGTAIDFTLDPLWEENMTLDGVWVYDRQGNELVGNADEAVLSTLEAGDYCIVLSVTRQGSYVEEGGGFERSGYEYIFGLRLTE